MFPELAPSMDAEDSSNESFRDIEGDFPLFAAVVKGEQILLFHSIQYSILLISSSITH
jgi:hypothetical protein